MLEEH